MRAGIRPLLPKRGLSEVPKELINDSVDISQALEMIMNARNVGPENARAHLLEACSSGKVRSRYFEAVVNKRGEKMIGVSAVPLDVWRSSPALDVNESSITTLDLVTLKYIGVIKTDLAKWLSRPRRGPAKGKLSRFGESDRALFSEIKQIMRQGSKSVAEAARDLDHEGKVNGRGTSDSRVRRLAKLYRKEHPQRVR